MTKSQNVDPTSRLRDAITNGQFGPGQRLIEAELANWLGTNRANVRTALARLERDGLVVSEPNRGARVRVVSEAEAIEITQVRGVLEGLLARLAAQRVTNSDRDRLRAFIRKMQVALKASNLIEYSKTNGGLHAEIARISGHVTAVRLLATLKSQLVRFQYRTILLPGRPANSLAEHEAIVDAICTSNPERAEKMMRAHLAHIAAGLSHTRDSEEALA